MKKIRMGLMALAAISGIGSAFAFNHPIKHKKAGVTYYGVGVVGNYQWFTSPSGSCGAVSSSNAACTITSTYDVTGPDYANSIPDGATIVHNSQSKLRH